MLSKAEKGRRNALSDHEAMIDAQGLCLPCKLCGGSAEITDAGSGAGYYIRCENAQMFRPSKGCIIADQRLGGWAYNVMDWWNRLHSTASKPETRPPIGDQEWCQPGDIRKRQFLVTFDDPECRNAVFDDETEARRFWAKACLNWNCYLFGALPVDPAPTPNVRDTEQRS